MKTKTLYMIGGGILLLGAGFIVYKTIQKRKKEKELAEQPQTTGGTTTQDPPIDNSARSDFGSDLAKVTKQTASDIRNAGKSLLDQML